MQIFFKSTGEGSQFNLNFIFRVNYCNHVPRTRYEKSCIANTFIKTLSTTSMLNIQYWTFDLWFQSNFIYIVQKPPNMSLLQWNTLLGMKFLNRNYCVGEFSYLLTDATATLSQWYWKCLYCTIDDLETWNIRRNRTIIWLMFHLILNEYSQ